MAVKNLKYDFGGYATKVGIKCSDGRTIIKDAFKHNDGQKVPLVWQHLHNDPANILGYGILEHRDDGVYVFGTFNETSAGKNAKELVVHGDITNLSIYANSLTQKGSNVIHGNIREVSLVLSGANQEAFIDNLNLEHSDGTYERAEEEAIIYTGLTIEHAFNSGVDNTEDALKSVISNMSDNQKTRMFDSITMGMEDQQRSMIYSIINLMTEQQRTAIFSMVQGALKHGGLELAEDGSILAHAKYAEDATVQEVFNSLDEVQKSVVYAMIAAALEESGEMEHSENNEGDNIMKSNVFDKSTMSPSITPEQIGEILRDAKKCGSLKDSVLAHASEYGIDNIEILFPEAQNIRTTPDLVKRDDDWVGGFLAAINKTPFSRIRSQSADLTAEEARAKGYVTGKRKLEEVFPVMKRITTPTTIYKKQKLDKDDIVDITDFDVVVWLKAEMRVLLNEEIARGVLIGDGRNISAEDKINEQNVRPVWKDDDLYTYKYILDKDTTTLDFIDSVVKARKFYKGSGNPNFYSTEDVITDMMLVRDLNQRRIYPTMTELASALRVKEVIAVEVMEDKTRSLEASGETVNLKGILLNPRDYTIGADKGGQVGTFEDFDIDYNQYKYLIETRISGALTKPRSAVAIEQKI